MPMVTKIGRFLGWDLLWEEIEYLSNNNDETGGKK